MITSLMVKGYRSLKDVKIDLEWLNVMIGPNGSGKTNIMDVLALLQEGARGNLSEWIARRGGIRSLLFAEGAKAIEIGAKFALWDTAREQLDIGISDPLCYEVQLAPAAGGYVVKSERVQGDDIREAALLQQPLSGMLAALSKAGPRGGKDVRAEPKPAELVLSQADALPLGPVRKRTEFVRLFLDFFVSLYRMPDTRPDAPMRQPQVVRAETELKPDSSNLAALLNLLSESDQRRRQYEAIKEELQAGFPKEFEDLRFPAAHGEGTIMMRWVEKAFPTRSFDTFEISDGIINFVRLATLIETSTWGPVCIDEPEVGLHPRLIRLAAEMLQAASKGTQFIVATHSPTLVAKLKPEEVLVVEKQDGASQVRRLDADELKHWLQDFSLDELWLSGHLERAS